ARRTTCPYDAFPARQAKTPPAQGRRLTAVPPCLSRPAHRAGRDHSRAPSCPGPVTGATGPAYQRAAFPPRLQPPARERTRLPPAEGARSQDPFSLPDRHPRGARQPTLSFIATGNVGDYYTMAAGRPDGDRPPQTAQDRAISYRATAAAAAAFSDSTRGSVPIRSQRSTACRTAGVRPRPSEPTTSTNRSSKRRP